eukprot:988657-Karenia_brevis.AAC.1
MLSCAFAGGWGLPFNLFRQIASLSHANKLTQFAPKRSRAVPAASRLEKSLPTLMTRGTWSGLTMEERIV